jgi:hypothetical protein
MIRYALKCGDGHAFDSWFQSAAAFDTLARAGHLSCAVCGGGGVEKTLMAPRVAADKARDVAAPQAQQQVSAEQQVQALAQMRRAVEENATYVGRNFARQARDMHEGTSDNAPIYGEASAAEARALIEDGVPVLPLPFRPKRHLQ